MRKGSTKSFTYSTQNGKQITKERMSTMKNVRSRAQMEQRCIMASAAKAYAVLKPIVDHSFQGVSYGAETEAAFLAENCKMLRENKNVEGTFFSTYKGDWALAPYVISKGSIPNVMTYVNDSVSLNKKSQTFGELKKNYDLRAGDYITFIVLNGYNQDQQDYEGNEFIMPDLIWARYPIFGEDRDSNTRWYPNEIECSSNAEILMDMSIIPCWVNTFIFDSAGWWGPSPAYVGIIVSKKRNGVWERSDCQLMRDLWWPYFSDRCTTFENALSTYPIGESYVLNGE